KRSPPMKFCRRPTRTERARQVSVASLALPDLRPASTLSLGDSCFALGRAGTGGKPAMESAARLTCFDPNGAGLSLPVARPTLRPVLVLERSEDATPCFAPP